MAAGAGESLAVGALMEMAGNNVSGSQTFSHASAVVMPQADGGGAGALPANAAVVSLGAGSHEPTGEGGEGTFSVYNVDAAVRQAMAHWKKAFRTDAVKRVFLAFVYCHLTPANGSQLKPVPIHEVGGCPRECMHEQ